LQPWDAATAATLATKRVTASDRQAPIDGCASSMVFA
jgi:hypothetical protein